MEIFRKLTSIFSGGKIMYEQNLAEHSNANQALQEIENMLFTLIRSTTVLKLSDATRLHPDSAVRSHFGGMPYFEEGMTWPETESGHPLRFVFQLFANDNTELPRGVKLIQFFYDEEEYPSCTDESGWLVKIYNELNFAKQVVLARPNLLDETPYCEILIESGLSLPDFEAIESYRPQIKELLNRFSVTEPWEVYEQVCEKLTGSSYYQSQLGGYPRWVQSESTPLNSKGKKAQLLFQIDSEDNADIMWGDAGLVYVFYDEADNKVWFELQCH